MSAKQAAIYDRAHARWQAAHPEPEPERKPRFPDHLLMRGPMPEVKANCPKPDVRGPRLRFVKPKPIPPRAGRT